MCRYGPMNSRSRHAQLHSRHVSRSTVPVAAASPKSGTATVRLRVEPRSTETTMGGPQRPCAAGSGGDQVGQFGFVGYGERDVSAPTTSDWSAIGLRGEATVREKPDVECGQLEHFAVSTVRPAECLRDRDVDRQSTHFQVAAHGRMVSRESPQAAATARKPMEDFTAPALGPACRRPRRVHRGSTSLFAVPSSISVPLHGAERVAGQRSSARFGLLDERVIPVSSIAAVLGQLPLLGSVLPDSDTPDLPWIRLP